jgi:hypothetical protein
MTRQRWGKWFWDDWENDPELRLCSLAAQGLWMRLLCIAAKAEPFGYVLIAGETPTSHELATIVGKSVEEIGLCLGDLERHRVFSRDRKKRIYSRRMVRDRKRAAIAQENGKLGGNPSLRKDSVSDVSDNPTTHARAGVRSASASDSTSQKKGYGGLGEKEGNGAAHPKPRDEFETWYRAYPLKRSRGAAERAFVAARKSASLDELVAGVERYKTTKRSDRDWQYPATWLNAKGWLDEPEPPRTPTLFNATGPPDEGAEFRAYLRKKAEGG